MIAQLILIGAADPAPTTNRPPSQRSRTWRRTACPFCGRETYHSLSAANEDGIPGWTCEQCGGVWYDLPWVPRPPLPEWRR